jgi:hypothetical protein
MTIDRRRFMGASLAASASLAIAPRAFAASKSAVRPGLLPQALAALDLHDSNIAHRDLVGIVDFTKHSNKLRFELVDFAGGRMLGSYLVAHGKGSDPANTGLAKRFSNEPGSHASSLGAYVTGDTYYGKHGRSRRLHGLESVNDLAYDRAIVIHGARYVDKGMARRSGRVGRSFGCFALEECELDNVLDRLGEGRLLFAAN